MNLSSDKCIELKSFSRNVGQNWYHIVLVPKARYPVFESKILKDIADDAFVYVSKKHNIELFAKEVMPDHVHLFVSCPPDYSIRKLFRILKGGSSYYIRTKYSLLKKYPHLWNRGTMYRSIGSVSSETVKHYIEKSNDWMKTKQRKLI